VDKCFIESTKHSYVGAYRRFKNCIYIMLNLPVLLKLMLIGGECTTQVNALHRRHRRSIYFIDMSQNGTDFIACLDIVILRDIVLINIHIRHFIFIYVRNYSVECPPHQWMSCTVIIRHYDLNS